MSDTPRTDERLFNASGSFCADNVVLAEFARQLESELNEALKDAARLDWMLDASANQLNRLKWWTRDDIDEAMKIEEQEKYL